MARAAPGAGPDAGVKRPAGAAMMASMTTGEAGGPRGPGRPARPLSTNAAGAPRAAPRPWSRPVDPVAPPADRLTDGELIAAVAQAGPSTVGAALRRNRVAVSGDGGAGPGDAVAPLRRVRRRHAAGGAARGAGHACSAPRRGGPRRAAADRPGPGPAGVAAAGRPAGGGGCPGSPCPPRSSLPLLDHGDTDVREPAFELAPGAGVRADLLREGLRASSAAIRRSAAIALGGLGDAEARAPLIGELARARPRSR